MASVGGVIGSGWLLASQKVATDAGPDSLWSWIIGGIIILFIALVYSELGSSFPESGALIRFPQYSHGSFVGILISIATLTAYISVPAAEIEAGLTYADTYIHGLTLPSGTLTGLGMLAGVSLLGLFFLINWFGVKFFARINTPLTWIKLLTPLATVTLFIIVGLHWPNLHTAGGLDVAHPAGGILVAISTGGIAFSYLGFRQSIDLSGEAKNPQKDIPRAVIGSLLIGIVVYTLLQLVFLGTVPPSIVAKGWAHLDYLSPFASLAPLIGLGWFSSIIFIDAIISPAGTANIEVATATRLVYAVGRNGFLPPIFTRISRKTHIPPAALLFVGIVASVFLFPFPSWSAIISITTSATVLTYVIGPVSAMVLRRQAPDLHRPVKMPAMGILAPIAFVGGSLILYWATWPTIHVLYMILAVGVVLWLISSAIWPKTIHRPSRKDVLGALWFMAFLAVLGVLSYYGPPAFDAPANHGKGALSLWASNGLVALAGLVFYALGVLSGWKTPNLTRHIAQENEKAAEQAKDSPR